MSAVASAKGVSVASIPVGKTGMLARTGRVVALNLLGIAVLLLSWQLGHVAIGQFLPPPFTVFGTALSMLTESRYLVGLGLPRGGFMPHLQVTTFSVLVGLAAGSFVGILTGLASAFSSVIRQVIAPLAAFVGTLPLLVAAPFFLMWFGVSATARISLVAVYSALVVHTYAFQAVGNMNRSYHEYAATLGAGRLYAFMRVVRPATMPEILGGIRVALGAAWGLVAITEILGSVTGIGRVIVATWGVYDITTMMAAILWLSLLALLLDGLMMLVREWMLRWA